MSDTSTAVGKSKQSSLSLEISCHLCTESVTASQCYTYSPVTNLAMSFCELVNDGFNDTPKASLCFDSSTEETPNTSRKTLKPITLDKAFSLETGNDQQTNISAPKNKGSFDLHKNESSLDKRSAAFRRFKSLPTPFDEADGCGERSPMSFDKAKIQTTVHDDEDSSQDSGLGLDRTHSPFAKPCAPAPRSRVLSDHTNTGPWVSNDFTGHFKFSCPDPEDVDQLSHRAWSPTGSDDGDDGFLEFGSLDSNNQDIPEGLGALLNNPLLDMQPATREYTADVSEHFLAKGAKLAGALKKGVFTSDLSSSNQENIKPKKHGLRRGLFRSPSTPTTLALDGVRSGDDWQDDCTPNRLDHGMLRQGSRNKSKLVDRVDDDKPRKKRKSVSTNDMNTMTIISALEAGDSHDVIGDFSKPYCLPTVTGSHPDLKCIDPDTVAELIQGRYKDIVDQFIIIDCRYPYEFDGGHIKNAINIWERDTMVTFHHTYHRTSPKVDKRSIIIFHCEFSSERAPKMSRFLREIDRDANCYPALRFPELYLLKGGYKAFYYKHKELCEPQTYKPMSHEDHQQELRKFRARSKSWAGEKDSKYGRVRSFNL